MKLLAGVVLAGGACGATAGEFDGSYVQAGAGVASSKTDIGFTGWFRAKPGDESFAGQLAVGHSLSLGQFNLAGNIHYTVGGLKAGKTVQASPFVVGESDDWVRMRLKNSWDISMEPGFEITGSTLVYAKLGYVRTQGKWTFARPFYPDIYSGTANFKGFGFGAGIKHNFSPKLFSFVEIQQNSYSRKDVVVTVTNRNLTESWQSSYTNNFKPESLTGFVGVGYRF
jgi:opacity protein-like surface antigen